MKRLLRFPSASILSVRGLIRWFRSALCGAAALLALGTLCTAASPYLLVLLIESASQGTGRLWTVGSLFLTVSVGGALFYAWGGVVASTVGDSAVATIRDSVVRVLEPLASEGKNRPQRLVSAVSGDAAALSVFFRYALPEVLPAAGALLAVMVGIVLVSPLLFLVILCGFLPLIWLGVRLVLANRRQYAAEREASGIVQGALGDLGSGKGETDLVTPLLHSEYRISSRAALVRSLRKAYLVLVEFVVLGMCLFAGLWLVGLGLTTVAAVASVAIFTFRMAGHIDVVLEHLDEYQLVGVAMQRINGALVEVNEQREVVH